jgi:hypothetical protein
MPREPDVIPIHSRRGPIEEPPHAPPPRASFALLGALGFVMAIGGLGVLYEGRNSRAVSRVPDPARNAIFERARQDLIETCALPQAADGPIRDHCVHQAQFVLHFPECDEACAQVARATLPRAQR